MQQAPPDPLRCRRSADSSSPSHPVDRPGIELTSSGANPVQSTSSSLSESINRPVNTMPSILGLTPAQRAAAASVIVFSTRHRLQQNGRETPRAEDLPPSIHLVIAHRLNPAAAARRSSSARNPAASAAPAPCRLALSGEPLSRGSCKSAPSPPHPLSAASH